MLIIFNGAVGQASKNIQAVQFERTNFIIMFTDDEFWLCADTGMEEYIPMRMVDTLENGVKWIKYLANMAKRGVPFIDDLYQVVADGVPLKPISAPPTS